MAMKTCLKILQETRGLMGLDTPTTLLSLTDQDEIKMRELLRRVCEELRSEGPYRQQVMTHDFATVASQNTYALPRAFYEALPLAYYNKDTDWRLIGPLSDAEFLAFKEGTLGYTAEYAWRIKGFDENSSSTEGMQFEVYPTPSAAENLTFDFIAGHLFIPPNWAASTVYSSGDYVNVNGRIYLCDTNGTSSSTPPSGTDDNQSDGTTQWDHYDDTYEEINDNGDLCLFDAHLVKLGVRAYFYEEGGGVIYETAKTAYDKRKVKSKFRWEGQTRVSGARRRTSGRHRPYVQSGSWSL